MRHILLISSLLLTKNALGDEYDLLSKHKELKETAIVEIGEIEELEKPPAQNTIGNIFKISNLCMRLTGIYPGVWSYGRKSGLLVVDKYGVYKMATIESQIKNIKITTAQVEPVDCQEVLSNKQRSVEQILNDMKVQDESFRRQQEATKKELERLHELQRQYNQKN
ncbi:hypothetical protein ACQE3D_23185 [Methylomonas sp. MS20]|uniref:hypothetical protein n=1 Tax=unclassified Methylomonas TaxID=2608980 RepID=UPI0028A3C294|nr:hypothetical protein [Methylomonas sp. MV1]MDT4331909.1 hypothetical protein [Methylomonas sp. MV1]